MMIFFAIDGARDWLDVVQNFGITTIVILFVGLCIWKGGGWLGENVIKPVVGRYISLLDALIASVAMQGTTMAKVGVVLEKEGDTLARVGAVLEKLGETLTNMATHAMRSLTVLEELADRIKESKAKS